MRKRPILVEFVKGEDVNLIMSKVGVLRGTNFFVHRDYSQEDRIKRGKLTSVRKEIMRRKRDAVTSFRRDALMVNDVAFTWDLVRGFRTAGGEDGVQALKEIVDLDLSGYLGLLVAARGREVEPIAPTA